MFVLFTVNEQKEPIKDWQIGDECAAMWAEDGLYVTGSKPPSLLCVVHNAAAPGCWPIGISKVLSVVPVLPLTLVCINVGLN